MIKKAQIKLPQGLPAPGVASNTLTQITKPKVVKQKHYNNKEELSFDLCLKQLQKPIPQGYGDTEDYLIDQELITKRLILNIDTKVLGKYILNKFKESKFKSFQLSSRTFVNMIEGYFEGTVDIEDIKVYQGSIPHSSEELWYEYFNNFRYEFINGIRAFHRELAFIRCIQILVESENRVVEEDPNIGTFKTMENCINLNKLYIIDLMQLVWPEQAAPLKLLFGC